MAGTSRKRQNTEDTGSMRDAKGTGSTRRNTSKETGSASKGKKRTDTGRSASGRKRTEELPEEEHSFMGTEVAIIGTFAISVLLFLSNFGLCGIVGELCRKVMLGIFGSMGYPAPILLFVGTCFYLSNRGNIRAVIKMAAVAAVLLALCGLAQLMFGGGLKEEWKLTEYFIQSGASGSGGGFIGGLLVVLLAGSLGTVGAYVVLFVALAIGAVCITERSLVNFVKQGSGKAYEYAREDMSRRRELHEERKEEKRRLREEQRVRGVDLDSTKLTDGVLMREFAAGIPEGMVLDRDIDKELDRDLEETDFADAQVSRQNPADVFRGKINAPYREDYAAEREEEAEPDLKTEKTAPHTERGVFDEPERTDSDRLLKNIYVRRDVRTFEELSGTEETASERAGFTVMPSSEEQEEQDPGMPWREDDDFGGHDFEDGENAGLQPDYGDTAYIEEEYDAQEDGYYKTTESKEGGVNYDSFFVPEEPKTVVTASGKVIETDTEMVKKTLEKKRAEKAKEPENELTVTQEIEKKAEAEKIIKKEYVFPPLDLLKRGERNSAFSDQEYRETAIKLQQTLQNFGVGVTVTNISCGPSVTRYELHPEQGVKVSKIVALSDDIKLSLAAADIRIEAPIPGKSAVGIEVPNKENHVVLLRDLLESEEFKRHTSHVAFAVGKDIGGQVVVTDIAKMPHLLIAGATGSGKSVCINTLIMSVIYKAKPEDVKLIMIDPKVVELSVYNGIPHLLIPVVTDPKKASGALNWAVAEMMDRYAKFAKYNVRDLKGYNEKIKNIEDIEDENKPEKLPQIIIIVDELADLMMVSPGEVEDAICRLAQLARAAGIHLVIATQRPSVNVITGLIKANVPSRIAFSVSSGVDSRTIIDMNGAEKLLGKGDMLFYPSGYQKPQRVQGAFVSDQEVSRVVEFLTEQGLTAEYNPEVQSKITSAVSSQGASGGSEQDAYFVQAGRFIIEKDKASIGMLQRMFKIGFNRAARIMDQLAEAGVVGEEEGTKPRKILMTMEQFENMLEE